MPAASRRRDPEGCSAEKKNDDIMLNDKHWVTERFATVTDCRTRIWPIDARVTMGNSILRTPPAGSPDG